MGRRRWSADDRARILEETLTPGAVVSAVARRHGLTPQQLFTWQREARKRLEAETAPAFVPAIVVAPEPIAAKGPQPRAKRRAPRRRVVAIELEASGVTVRTGSSSLDLSVNSEIGICRSPPRLRTSSLTPQRERWSRDIAYRKAEERRRDCGFRPGGRSSLFRRSRQLGSEHAPRYPVDRRPVRSGGRLWPTAALLKAARAATTSWQHFFPTCYGLEFIAKAVREWIVAVGAKTAIIEPGAAHRQQSASRSRGMLLRHAGRTGHGCVTQTK